MFIKLKGIIKWERCSNMVNSQVNMKKILQSFSVKQEKNYSEPWGQNGSSTNHLVATYLIISRIPTEKKSCFKDTILKTPTTMLGNSGLGTQMLLLYPLLPGMIFLSKKISLEEYKWNNKEEKRYLGRSPNQLILPWELREGWIWQQKHTQEHPSPGSTTTV